MLSVIGAKIFGAHVLSACHGDWGGVEEEPVFGIKYICGKFVNMMTSNMRYKNGVSPLSKKNLSQLFAEYFSTKQIR